MCRALGAPEVLRIENVPPPALGPGQVRVRVRAAGVNFPDKLMIAGLYQHKPALPFIAGMEAAGEVIESAPEVALAPGARVLVGARTGAFAEEMVVPAAAVKPLPAGFDFVHGAAFRVAFTTACVALVRRAALAPGETLLVHGAAGGVGLGAVQLGKVLGARIIATVSTEAKAAAVREAGADHVIVSAAFRTEVKDLTRGAGADVIYDPVGGDVFDESLHCIAWGGRILVVGFADGRIPEAPVNLVLIKGCAVIGVRAGEFGRRDPQAAEENWRTLHALAEQGRITPRIHARLPLAEAARALNMLGNREVIGKVVLEP